MPIEIIATITMLKGILDTTIATATQYKTDPKKRVARELLAVSETLEDVESNIEEAISHLEKFSTEEHIGMKVHHIHTVGVHFRELQLLFRKFSIWMEKGRGISGIKMFDPYCTMENLRHLRQLESGEHEITEAIRSLTGEIQAVRSPNPKDFPQPDTIEEVRQGLITLLTETKKSREKLRQFVVKHFELEDLF